MRILTYGLLSVLVLMCAGTAFGQQEKGDVELQLVGSYFRTVGTDFSFGSGTVSGRIGYYFTNNFELGAGPTLTITTTTSPQTLAGFDPVTFQPIYSGGGSETKTTFGSYIFFVYSFLTKNAKLVPYLGAQYFKQDFSDSEDKGSVGINGGVKYFFTKKVAFDLAGNYLWSLTKDAKGGLILITVGLSFLI